ncbi:hypothetical protein D3C81_1513060 [compost metagenome]
MKRSFSCERGVALASGSSTVVCRGRLASFFSSASTSFSFRLPSEGRGIDLAKASLKLTSRDELLERCCGV